MYLILLAFFRAAPVIQVHTQHDGVFCMSIASAVANQDFALKSEVPADANLLPKKEARH